MIFEETYTLSNGVKIPKLGLGTWFIADDQVAAAIGSAVKLGYRHIDTAQAYENERGVGEGIRSWVKESAAVAYLGKNCLSLQSWQQR